MGDFVCHGAGSSLAGNYLGDSIVVYVGVV